MPISGIYQRLLDLATREFGHVVDDGQLLFTPAGSPQKLRLELIDGSVIDVFLSPSGRYAYHWERRHLDGAIYRHDNAPHASWRHLSTFPKHFHMDSETADAVTESTLSDDPDTAMREFLRFVDGKLG